MAANANVGFNAIAFALPLLCGALLLLRLARR